MELRMQPYIEWWRANPVKGWAVTVFLALMLVIAGMIVWAPLVPQWGMLHEPHSEARFKELRSGHTLSQTFLFEYPVVDTIAILLDTTQPLPNSGDITLRLEAGKKERIATVAFDQVLSDGLVLFRIEPLSLRAGE